MRTTATLLQEALTVAERSGDTVGLAETEWGLAQVCYYAADAKEALLHGECALALARERDLKELMAHSLNVLAHIYELWATGKRLPPVPAKPEPSTRHWGTGRWRSIA
jgi:hypothetical protein